jgi:hypothetical protein
MGSYRGDMFSITSRMFVLTVIATTFAHNNQLQVLDMKATLTLELLTATSYNTYCSLSLRLIDSNAVFSKPLHYKFCTADER